jgi:hypothetical protein
MDDVAGSRTHKRPRELETSSGLVADDLFVSFTQVVVEPRACLEG